MSERLLYYYVSDYFGTGEGVTVCILVTPKSVTDGAMEMFREEFDDFYMRGIQEYTKEEILDTVYSKYIPEAVWKMIDENDFGNLKWTCKFHINFS